MATGWIREYADMAESSDGDPVPIPMEPGKDQTPVTFTTSSPSAAFAGTTRFIAVNASADFHYAGGETPVATTNALKVAVAAGPLFMGVRPGHKIALIAAA